MMGKGALNPLKRRQDLGKSADQAEINLDVLEKILWILLPVARAGRDGRATIVSPAKISARFPIFRNI
jgi:hypothetical protein